jgi:hypothetical protein
MISFDASLFSGLGVNGVTMDSKCSTFTIQDYSNYSTNTESGHTAADFSQYRVIVITHQSGITYTLSALAGGNQTISAPSSGQNVFTAPVFNGDGVYYFDIFTVPTFNSMASYTVANNECVYYNGSLYKASQDSTGQTPSATSAYWTVITQSQLSAKYFDEAFVGVACATKTCFDATVKKALCNVGCNPAELCSNPCYLAADQLGLLYYNIQTALYNNDPESAELFFDTASSICANCQC